MSNRFGAYVLSHFDRVMPHLPQWKPSLVVLHDGEAKKENVDKVRQLSPSTKIIGRLYKSDSWYNENIRRNPEAAAQQIVAELDATDWAHHVDWVLAPNEVCQDWSGLSFLSRYHVEFQRISEIPQVLGSFSVENPGWSNSDADGQHASLMKHWQLFYPAMYGGLAHGDLLGLHQYNANRITLGHYQAHRNKLGRRDAGGLMRGVKNILATLSEDMQTDVRRVFRYETLVYPFLPEQLQHLPFAHTEFGWDFLLWPYNYKAGWLEDSAAISTDDANGQLSWYSGVWDDAFTGLPLVGCVLFGAGDSGSWHLYDITSVEMANGERRSKSLITVLRDSNTGGDWPKTESAPPELESVEAVMIAAANEEQCISGNFKGELQNTIIVDGHFPVSNEFQREVNNVQYTGQKGEATDKYDPRVYYTRTGDWDNILNAHTDKE